MTTRMNHSIDNSMRRMRRIVVALAVVSVGLAACDTGDGKTLREPTGTLPPPTTTTTPAQDDALETLPLEAEVEQAEPLPDDFDGDDFRLTAPWVDGTPIGARYTCDGDGATPALSWAEAPSETVELAVVMIDEMSPDTTSGVHWVMAGIDPGTIRLVEDEVPVGAIRATNSFGDVGWTAPCPDPGTGPQTYRFTVYALGQQAEISDAAPAADAIAFIEAVAFSSTDVLGTYER